MIKKMGMIKKKGSGIAQKFKISVFQDGKGKQSPLSPPPPPPPPPKSFLIAPHKL